MSLIDTVTVNKLTYTILLDPFYSQVRYYEAEIHKKYSTPFRITVRKYSGTRDAYPYIAIGDWTFIILLSPYSVWINKYFWRSEFPNGEYKYYPENEYRYFGRFYNGGGGLDSISLQRTHIVVGEDAVLFKCHDRPRIGFGVATFYGELGTTVDDIILDIYTDEVKRPPLVPKPTIPMYDYVAYCPYYGEYEERYLYPKLPVRIIVKGDLSKYFIYGHDVGVASSIMVDYDEVAYHDCYVHKRDNAIWADIVFYDWYAYDWWGKQVEIIRWYKLDEPVYSIPESVIGKDFVLIGDLYMKVYAPIPDRPEFVAYKWCRP